MKAVAMAIAAGLAVGSATAEEGNIFGQPIELTAEQWTLVEGAVKDKLKDPESSQFSGVNARGIDSAVSVCGWVNARNSFGGYVGKQPFYVLAATEQQGTAVLIGSSDIALATVVKICREAELPLE